MGYELFFPLEGPEKPPGEIPRTGWLLMANLVVCNFQNRNAFCLSESKNPLCLGVFSPRLPCEIDFNGFPPDSGRFQSISIDFLSFSISFSQFRSVLISLTQSKTQECIDNRKVGENKNPHFPPPPHPPQKRAFRVKNPHFHCVALYRNVFFFDSKCPFLGVGGEMGVFRLRNPLFPILGIWAPLRGRMGSQANFQNRDKKLMSWRVRKMCRPQF